MNGIGNYFKKFWLFTIIAGIVGGAEVAKADFLEPWTTIAAAGTVDEADTSIVLFGTGGFSYTGMRNSSVTIKSDATLPANLDLRYNVVSVDGLFVRTADEYGHEFYLNVAYEDNGSSARVLVRLRRLNIATGALTTLLTFDSNNYAQSATYQTQDVRTSACATSWEFDFNHYAYYCEAAITKSASTGSAILHAIQIYRRGCPIR